MTEMACKSGLLGDWCNGNMGVSKTLARGSIPRSPALRRLRITDELTIPLAEVAVRASRSSGPGGQHANVTASRVEASFDVLASATLSETQRERLLARTGPRVVAISQDARSQTRNRELALTRLEERLAKALARPRRRRPTRPTAASRERRLQDKRRATERKRERRPPDAQ
jgi:ribosome-associated protein